MNKLDRDIQELKERKRLLMSLERLMINADFKKVILDDYLTKHPLNLVKGRGMLGIKPETTEDTIRQLDAVALFETYLQNNVAQIADIDVLIHEAETLRANETRN